MTWAPSDCLALYFGYLGDIYMDVSLLMSSVAIGQLLILFF